ncbi:DNA mismatch repair endonuclease MutL [Limosilactobacillus sp.]|uniref:DNA mismatch repair endonuclease MutL n=1 Tax=Limosilactobacillus sp. TaxID=2773925 RepID=UPI00345E937D
MGKIHQLNAVLADQIAAGEVIERPASIVKELVENSLDAGSTRIDVLAEDAGMTSIRVIDNGSGIAHEDVPLAFKRHATSKIASERDLFNVQTMGFRGEALPSIASVADVQMTTAIDGAAGTAYHIKGGQELSEQAASARQGTDILVRQLFYNTPARLKYIKSPHTELSRMVDIINRLALANPKVAISFSHNQRELFRSAGNGNLQQVIAAIYGVKAGRQMLAVQGQDPDFVVSGFTSLPALNRASRAYITLTINHRYVRNYALTRAVIEGYKSKLMVGRYPIAVLNIQLNPLLVDVNVHPAKREVRLSKEDQLTKLISNLVAQSIDQANLIPDIGDRAIQIHEHQRVDEEPLDIKPGHSAAVKYPTGVTPPVESTQTPTDQQKQFHHTTQTVSGDHDSANPAAADAGDSFVKEPVVIHSKDELRSPQMAEFDRHYQQGEAATPFADESEKIAEPDQSSQKPVKAEQQELAIDDRGDVKEDQFPQLQYIGQLQGTFLLAQASDGLYIVDQHAAQERINFEKFRRELGQVSPDQQQFLTPLVLTYSTSDALKISDHLAVLQGVGLNLEQFGQNSFMLASHPTWFIDGQEEDTAREMIDWVLKDGKLTVGQFRLKAAAMMSCKRAIKANHHLDRQQAQALLVNLSHCENPYNCPHGRPVTIHFTDTDLEKMFKRIQDHHEPYADDFDDHEI